jgi:transcriptional regulator with XRE-family HTH domain
VILIKAIRTLRNLKQSDVASAMGRDQSWVSRVENGEIMPSATDVEKLARVLKVNKRDIEKSRVNVRHLSGLAAL